MSCVKRSKNESFHEAISYQNLLNNTDFFNNDFVDFYKIKYLVDTLNIEGFIVKPNQNKTEKLPAIIFCRGGNQSFGMLNGYQLRMMGNLSAEGYVVLGSQLRGNMASEGVDEFGGKDLNDILKLIEIAKELDFVDEKNIHILGYSRGGMNTYQISKLTDNINSIAVVGAPTNKFESIKFRESMYHQVYKPLFGDTITNKEAYFKRSAVYWHKEINEPILILHGTDDNRVAVEEAKQLIDSLKISGKTDFSYKLFEGGNHTLSNFADERDSLIINWFKTHSK
ncbi:alpha/beta hydrolase family protein [Algibacter sp. L1A34]|uniref:alpha/beta hydrolase family protein n=1 Tax=Algibacter sp. L1A34 TaxID=2686365 RepID=UPI00131DE62F|nr:prolyl oligopeptidase family serine peptidase [Algibacter sp. L1A34]